VTEENKYLDELFQSKFAGFEAKPPAIVWNNIHKELHGKGGGSVNPVTLASLAALMLIAGLLGFSIIKDSPHTANSGFRGDNQTQIHFDNGNNAGSNNTVLIPDNKSSAYENISFATNEVVGTTQPSASFDPLKTGNENSTSASTPHATLHKHYAETTFATAFYEETHLAKLKASKSFSIHTSMTTLNSDNIQVRDSKYHPMFDGMNDGERRYNRKEEWQLGLHFMPEVIFYPDDSIPNQRSYTFDFSAKWKKNEFFIESGLGVSFSSDNGKYVIDYEKYLGSYNDVYNVTFDSTENGIVPVYHTSLVNVYDSISKFKIEQTKNHYTYLQIPLYIGFHKQVKRFGWFLKGGPVFSVLVNKSIPSPDVGDDKIIDLDQRMPARMNTNWQFTFSAGVTYQLSDKVSIAIEPTLRYYLKSQYERKYITTRHPCAFGLRTGLLFNL
jgi:hypothetical protein